MNTTIHKFTFLFTTCLLACSVLAQRGPQDTWYETGRVPLPLNCDPHDLIVTQEGTILLTDVGNDKIHEFEANGTLIRSFGSAGTGEGQFTNPVELAIGPGNRIYVTDTSNHRIQILERNGTFVKTFGTNGTGDGQFNKPRGLAISSDNEVFISEEGNHRVQVFDANGTFLRKWGTQGNLDGQLNRPLSLDVDFNGDVYVIDFTNIRVNVFDKEGAFKRKFNTSGEANYGKAAFLSFTPTGLLLTGGESSVWHQKENFLKLRERDGSAIKTFSFPVGGADSWGVSSMLHDGTIVFASRHDDKLYFLTQTYRVHRPTPSRDAPLPEVISVTQPAGTNHLEIKYRITDADSAKVKAGLLAFKDGGNDLTKVIVPKTFVGSVAGKLDENTTTGVVHTVTWDAKADWNVSYGNVEMAVVAQDDRDLMNFHFLTLPATDSNSTPLKISRSPITNGDCLNAWYTLLALENNDFAIDGNEIRANSGVVYTSSSGTTTNSAGRGYLFNKMNLRQATTAELTRAREAATPGVTNKFTPSFKVGPGERPVKVNEYGFDSDSTSSSHYWVVPKN